MTVDDASGDHVAVLPRRRTSLSIKTLILLMLLLVSVGSNIVVGVIGYVNGTESLRAAAYDRLIEVRDARAREIGALFGSIESSLLLASRDSAVVDAEMAFAAGVAELEASGDPLSEQQEAELEAYFSDDFGPRLEEATGEDSDVTSFVPTTAAARYLLYHYVVSGGEDPSSVDDAGDGSAWSGSHSEFHDYLRRMADLYQFGDLVLIDPSGQVVYSVAKGVDLGADLTGAGYSFTPLASAFRQSLSGNRLDSVAFTDFDEYAPALDRPTAWAAAPLAGPDSIVGVIAVQLPIDRINEVMTGGGSWEESGLGETGEVYLVGDDYLMRSLSRDLVEDPDHYVEQAVAQGLPQEDAERAVATGDTLLIQPVNTEAAKNAFDGEVGTITALGYLGGTTIAAYSPLPLPGELRWAIVAEIDDDEALAPVQDFTSRLAISSAILVLVVSVISVIIAGLAVRPLRRLRDAARRIAAGESGVQVEAGESDELADVAVAFNDMSRSLEIKARLIEEQKAENERLLHQLMPEALIKRFREGARTIVEDHQEVTVLFADIVGFEDFGRGLPSERALDLLNDIFRAFDEAADEFGVERVRTTRQGYLASCGLTIPRVDNARRAVNFAIEMSRIVERFAAQQGTTLSVRAGLDTGTVTSGLVGRSHVVYDLWGDAVSLAFRLQGGTSETGVFVTQRVVDKIPDSLPYIDSGVVETSFGSQRVWRIDPDAVGD